MTIRRPYVPFSELPEPVALPEGFQGYDPAISVNPNDSTDFIAPISSEALTSATAGTNVFAVFFVSAKQNLTDFPLQSATLEFYLDSARTELLYRADLVDNTGALTEDFQDRTPWTVYGARKAVIANAGAGAETVGGDLVRVIYGRLVNNGATAMEADLELVAAPVGPNYFVGTQVPTGM